MVSITELLVGRQPEEGRQQVEFAGKQFVFEGFGPGGQDY